MRQAQPRARFVPAPSVGAELSLTGAQTPLIRTMTELGVNTGVVLALSIALVLVRRLARLDRA